MKNALPLAVVLIVLGLPTPAWADLTAQTSLAPGNVLNLETGLIAVVGGDLRWDGTSIIPQGTATITSYAGVVSPSLFALFTAAEVSGWPGYSSTPLNSGNSGVPLIDVVIFVHDNAGHYAKLQIIGNTGSLALSFTTFGASAGPVISQILNNYSFIQPGVPNYGIAPGSLFVVIGTALNDQPLTSLQSSAPPGLPTTLMGTSITVNVNNTIVHPAIYYTSPNAVGAVLPSVTPLGTGVLTLSNGLQSYSVPIQVVQSALGLDTYAGTGSGLAVVQDAGFNLLTPSNPATPGQTIILWGSGTGPDTSNDDRTFPLNQNNLTKLPFDFYVGGIQAAVAYRGRSQYPGVDQIVITIPPGVTPGCGVGAWAVTGTISSNFVTIPISATGAPCTDLNLPTVSGKVNQGVLAISEGFAPPSTSGGSPLSSNGAAAQFFKWSPLSILADPSQLSLGSCTVFPASATAQPVGGLDAGTTMLRGPNGPPVALPAQYSGSYGITPLPTGFFQPSGTYTFTNSAGGKDVGPFQASVDFPAQVSWPQLATLTSVTRSAGLTVTWQGGDPNTWIAILGHSTTLINNGSAALTIEFVCVSPATTGQFLIPPAVLNSLPAGMGEIQLRQTTYPKTFSAMGLDIGWIEAFTTFTVGGIPIQ